MNTPKFTTPQYLAHLKSLRAKAALHTATTALVLCASIDSMIKSVESDGYDDRSQAYAALVVRARERDPVAMAEVTKIRQTRINNYLSARSNWLMFFNQVTLGVAEIAEYIHESRQEVRIGYSGGADGGYRRSNILKFKDHVQVPLFPMTSEMYEYFLWDPYRGSIADEIKALIDIAGDLEEKISQKAKTFVDAACLATFTLTGARQARTFFTHSSIATGNLPLGNILDVHTAGRWSKAAMDGVAQYCAAFGTLFGEVLKPEVVMLPSSDATGQLADVSLTSQQNDMTAQIFGGGQIVDYGGYKWTIVPDVTLSPDVGSGHAYAYVKMNKPIGDYFHKPDGDKTHDNPQKDGPLGNTGEMGMKKWIGFATPLQWNPFVLKVQYK